MVRRRSWLAVLVGGIGLFEAVRRVLVTTGNPNLLPSLLLVGAAVSPAAFVTFVGSRQLAYGTLGRHVDTRGVGGYVVAAGSLRRVGGRPGRYRLTDSTAPQPLPGWLAGLLAPPTHRSPVRWCFSTGCSVPATGKPR